MTAERKKEMVDEARHAFIRRLALVDGECDLSPAAWKAVSVFFAEEVTKLLDKV